MIPTQEAVPVQFVAYFCKSKRSKRDELRFCPVCSDCAEVIFNIEEANIAVVNEMHNFHRVFDRSGKLKRVETRNGIRMSRIEGTAVLLCWDCDQKRGNNIPWQNALATFRGLDELQRYPEAACVTLKPKAAARKAR